MARPVALSAPERAQLGTTVRDVPHFADDADWLAFRQQLLAKSAKRNPGFFDPDLAAYTPGETLDLLDHPQIKAWHDQVAQFKVPAGYSGIALVPCAASKPWRDHPNMRKSKLYQAYNRLISRMERGELPKLYFMTVSEPLGLVPQDQWNRFPAYDNPGLFKDDFLRTGLVKTDWLTTPWGQRHRLPFDEVAYHHCIERLAATISATLTHNVLPLISFVDDPGMATTHGHMLDVMCSNHPEIAGRLTRHPKRLTPRVDPTEDLAHIIADWNHASPLPRRARNHP